MWPGNPVLQHYTHGKFSFWYLNSCLSSPVLEHVGLCGSGTACPLQGCARQFGRDKEEGGVVPDLSAFAGSIGRQGLQ